MKEEISQQRGTIVAHWYTNNLPENRAPKTNVDVVDKKVNSEIKISTRELCVPHGRPNIRPEGVKRIGSNEAFPFGVKNQTGTQTASYCNNTLRRTANKQLHI